ncbi:class I SAM-dependent methyltransferase [Nocardioides bizhenqiangii]|uniref:SAM-dependent methyltransferase n=1 Tax=Nocardioides bizhenqiangii TaxID=3095076 RepID=A0ABZ0ZT37_9ACTN|nr:MULTISPECIES: SAM-dependent methyltransferase [unclassified Nocardioides]MDZ5622821.1 SAM-dependent methyltransferase [Nocardioides sp. HM23]WQQ27081.1 SAM-dependent methyltransferase [Nocardioides sp. HM61]
MSSTTEPLAEGLARIRDHLLDPDSLVRGLGSGRQKGQQPRWRRAELRWVDLKAGRHLQVTTYDATQAYVANHLVGDAAGAAVDALLAEPFGNWHVETTTEVHQLRVTKKLDAITHTSGRAAPVEAVRAHDREKERLLPGDDPVLAALGLADAQGRIKPSRQAKYRQVEEFVRILDASITEALGNQLRTPTPDDPLRIVDLGCGNGYLTFAAHRYLTQQRGLPVRLVGVDVKQQSAEHNGRVADDLGIVADFVVGTIAGAILPERDQQPDVVLALHACDTATDEALARAIEWRAPLVLAAPCCHHDVAAQLRKAPAPAPYSSLTRHGILRERFADTLTDALREMLLRLSAYRVDVMQFVESKHTPRNTLLRAVRTGAAADPALRQDYDDLVATWQVTPRLAVLLGSAGVSTGSIDEVG